MEELDELDEPVLQALGYAVARGQLLELAMAKLLEAQRHDLSVPLNERWDEVGGWLKLTAGQLAKRLGVPPAVAGELRQLVVRRNHVAHQAWLGYQAAREHAQGDAASKEWVAALHEHARLLGLGYNAVMALTHLQRGEGPGLGGPAEVERAWRQRLPSSVAGMWDGR